MLSVIMLSVVMLNVFTPTVVAQNELLCWHEGHIFVMLSVIRLSVVMLTALALTKTQLRPK